jgi:hypothetical protein
MSEELRSLHEQGAALVNELADKCQQAAPGNKGYVNILRDFAELLDRGARLLDEQPQS